MYRPISAAPEFSRALAHALLIAGLLSFTVDLYLKARLLKEVASDVSKFLVGYSLPDEVRDRIQGLMHEKLVRRNFQIRIRLVRESEADRTVRLHIEISDEPENISNEPIPFTDSVEYEKHERVEIIEMRCDSDDARAQYSLDGQGLAKEKEGEPGLMRAAAKKIKVLPHNGKSGIKYKFTAKWEVVQPENYSDIISFIYPTMKAIVEVDSPRDFKFTLSPTADVKNKNHWEYNRLFLPGQHIRYRWEPIPPPTE